MTASTVPEERFAPIIGDAGVDFIKEDIDLALDDYGVFIEETPRLIDDLNSFQSIVMAGLQAGQIRFDDAMKLMMEKDVVSGVRRLEKIMRKREEEEFERQRQLQAEAAQQQLESQMRMQEYNNQTSQIAATRAERQQQIKNQGQLQNTQLANQGALQNTAAKTRGSLSELQIEALIESLKPKKDEGQ